MGIKNLWKEINQYCEKVPKDDFRDKTSAIDADLLLYKHYYISAKYAVMREKDIGNALGDEYEFRQKIMTIFLGKILNVIINHLSRRIKPVLVFDGRPPEAKAETIRERIALKEQAAEEFAACLSEFTSVDELEPSEEDENNLKKSALNYYGKLRYQDKHLVKRFFRDIGVPVIVGNDAVEAERICAILCRERNVDVVESRDGDVLAHLSPVIIKESGKNDDKVRVGNELKEVYVICKLQKVLDELELTQEQFQQVCILSGCDYNESIKYLSFKTMMGYIKEYGSFENLLERVNNDTDNLTKSKKEKFINGVEQLKFDECVELFSFVPSDQLIGEGSLDFTYDINDVTEAFDRYGLLNRLERYNKVVSHYVEINEIDCLI